MEIIGEKPVHKAVQGDFDEGLDEKRVKCLQKDKDLGGMLKTVGKKKESLNMPYSWTKISCKLSFPSDNCKRIFNTEL